MSHPRELNTGKHHRAERNSAMSKLDKYANDGLSLIISGLQQESERFLKNTSAIKQEQETVEIRDYIHNTIHDSKVLFKDTKEKISSSKTPEDILYVVDKTCVSINTKASMIQNKIDEVSQKNPNLEQYIDKFAISCKALATQIDKFSHNITQLAAKIDQAKANSYSSEVKINKLVKVSEKEIGVAGKRH